jgi:hypothetical protein
VGYIGMRCLLCLLAISASHATHVSVNRNVSFDERSAIIDGERQLMLSGAVHYPRVPPEDWDRVFKMAKEMGLNTIQTYVFWNYHEHHEGNVTWDKIADDMLDQSANLTKFIETAAENDLFVVLRIGPYVCGEYYFGGIPVWVRTLQDIKCFRCADPVWEEYMEKWTRTVVKQVEPLLASNGGPIVMMQIENEYNADLGYQTWAVEMARNITTEVPWNICHSIKLCTEINNKDATGYKFQSLCTINGFWMDVWDVDNKQPSPKWIEDLRSGNPGQPTIWTEDQGWFDQWGVGKRVRDPRDQLYGIARFFAYGGSWHNFYMLTGGNNYGRLSGGEVVTAYAPDTVIDYLFLRHEPRFSYYGRWFKTLQKYSKQLLNHPIPPRSPLTPIVFHSMPNAAAPQLTVSPCTDDDPAHMGKLDTSQQFVFEADPNSTDGYGQLRSKFGQGDMCLNALLSTSPPELSSCSTGAKVDEALLWKFETSTSHLASKATGKCTVPGAEGKCHRCLDSSSKLTLWDCKSSSSRTQSNQYWHYNTKKENGVRPGKASSSAFAPDATSLCLTVDSTGAGGAEAHIYGDVKTSTGVAFLSNYDTAEDYTIAFMNRYVYPPSSSPCISDALFHCCALALSLSSSHAMCPPSALLPLLPPTFTATTSFPITLYFSST